MIKIKKPPSFMG